MMWKRASSGEVKHLPEERKALAERYTIDTAEAQRREQLAAEAAAREAEEQARRAAVAELEREATKQAEPVAEPQPQMAPASRSDPSETNEVATVGSRESKNGSGASETALEEEEPTANPELPIYRWFGRT